MALRKPSQKSVDLYNQLVKQQNEVRKRIMRIHKHAEETLGAGRLPALVVPKRVRKISMRQFEGLSKAQLKHKLQVFWGKFKSAKEMFGKGLTSYLSKTVKEGYMDLWRDQILYMSGESPEGVAKMFTKEQIENSYMGEFMQTYNRLNRLSSESFLAFLYHGDIIAFKWIYLEMTGQGRADDSWLEQQNVLLNKNSSIRRQKEILYEMTGFEKSHPKKTMQKAEERKRREEEED